MQLQLQLHCATSNHLSVHQWVRSTIHHSQQPTSYRFSIFETSATSLCGTAGMCRCENEKRWRWEDDMRGCEDERVWRWEDDMRGCEDEKMICVDVKMCRMWKWEDDMCRCEAERMWTWEVICVDVRRMWRGEGDMCRCEVKRMWRYEQVSHIIRTLRSDALGNISSHRDAFTHTSCDRSTCLHTNMYT